MRYVKRHYERVQKYIESQKPRPRRVRKEQARIVRYGKRKGIIE